MGIDANARMIFSQRDIPHIVISIFGPPVIADRAAEFLSAQNGGGYVEGSFITMLPRFGFGVEALAISCDFDNHLDQLPFLSVRECRRDEGFNFPAFDPVASFRHWLLINIIWHCGFRDRFTVMEQRFLVAFDLYNDFITGFLGRC
jgi:hypothetical protein